LIGFNLHLDGLFRFVPPGSLKRLRVLSTSVELRWPDFGDPYALVFMLTPTVGIAPVLMTTVALWLFARSRRASSGLSDGKPFAWAVTALLGPWFVAACILFVTGIACGTLDYIRQLPYPFAALEAGSNVALAGIAVYLLGGATVCARLVRGCRPRLRNTNLLLFGLLPAAGWLAIVAAAAAMLIGILTLIYD